MKVCYTDHDHEGRRPEEGTAKAVAPPGRLFTFSVLFSTGSSSTTRRALQNRADLQKLLTIAVIE